ncbi:CHASE2 domain-containing protein [Jejudonia soesokkakensis]|uniref:CHASE2 domain-containing protein n=1 Tax=Jejudonia soesokkakensis TaxID=1323432 RepID=A0ABW2MXG3_9FLAO
MGNRKLLFREAFYCMLFSFVVLGIASFILVNLSIFNPFANAFKDFSFLDLFYTEKMGEEYPVNQEIILVNIEHRDRFELAELLDHIQQQQPKVIGVDLIFREEREAFSDSLLKLQLQKPNVVNSFAFVGDGIVSNDEFFRNKTTTEGYSNINFDAENGVIREFEGVSEIQNKKVYSFPVKVAQQVLSTKEFSAIEKKLQQSNTIKYYGGQPHFLTFGFDEVMEDEALPILKDKIILLGYLGVPLGNPFDVEDKHFTPLNAKAVGKSIPDMNGIVIHANTLQMLLTNDFIYKVPNWILILITVLLTYISLVYFIQLNKKAKARYTFTKKLVQLFFTVVFLYIALYLLTADIYLKSTGIIAVCLLSVECIGIYLILIKYLKTKYAWKSYIYQ